MLNRPSTNSLFTGKVNNDKYYVKQDLCNRSLRTWLEIGALLGKQHSLGSFALGQLAKYTGSGDYQ